MLRVYGRNPEMGRIFPAAEPSYGSGVIAGMRKGFSRWAVWGAHHPGRNDRRRSRERVRSVVVVVLLVAAGAIAQVVTPTPPPTYCSPLGCFATLDQAESAMRAQTAYQGAGHLLEHMATAQMGSTTLRMQYWLRDRPADLIRAPSYFANYGPQGSSTGACALGDDQTALPGWCSDLSALVTLAESRLRSAWTGCTLTGTEMIDDFDADLGVIGSATHSTRGIADYSLRWYVTRATCPTGARSSQWSVAKKRPYYCTPGFGPAPLTDLTEATLVAGNVCAADNNDVAYITVPIQQCGSCAGSPSPIHPATCEKQRHETDFVFAGTAFTRHYRSLRQFRNHRGFAIAWTHTWSDRVLTGATAGTFVSVDDTGNYELFVLLAGNRYRGENSANRVLEHVNADGIGWRLRDAGGEVREFDLNGYLIAVRHADDPRRDVSIAYTDKAIATIADAQGRVLRFEYTANRLTRIVLPDASAVAYGYDANLNLASVTYPGGAVRQYHYNEPGLAGAADQRHHLTGITAEDGQRYASFAYDARGRAISSRVHGAPDELTTVGYPTEDSATLATTTGGSDAYAIQPGTYRRILNFTDSAGTQTRTYDAQGRLATLTDARGVRSAFAYQDAFLTQIIRTVGSAEEQREEIDFDPVAVRATEHRIRDTAGTLLARTVWAYNTRGQAVTVARIDPVSGQSRAVALSYCETADVAAGACPMVGLLKAVDGPRADVTDTVSFSYRQSDAPGCETAPTTCAYRKGDLWKTTNALGQATEALRFDGAGRLVSLRDANGVVTDLEYDTRGRTTASKVRGTNDASEVDDRITRIDYDPVGTVHRVTLPDGGGARFSYDPAQRLTAITDAAGNRITYTLNAAGQHTREDTRDASGALLRTLSATYDALGRMQTQVDADQHSTRLDYDAEDQLTLTTDALGRKTGHDYDALGRLRSTLQDVEGIAAQTTYRYDGLNRLTEVTDPNGLRTTYVHNAWGEALRQTSPDTGATLATYDNAGNPVTRTDARGVTVGMTYDALNRLIGLSYPDSSRNVGYAYDSAPVDCQNGERFAQGRLSTMSDASGNTVYCYDRYGQLARKIQTTQGKTFTLRYLHTDPRGRLPGQDYALVNPPPGNQHIGWTYPDGASIRILRDANARPIELRVTQSNGQTTTLLRNATYYPFGPVSQWTYGNGRTLRRSLNQNYRPGFVEDIGPGGISEGYWFDAAGNLEALRHANQLDPTKRAYRYDGLNRLTEVREGGANTLLQGYAYDKTGNRTGKTTASGQTSVYAYAPGKHHLNQVGGIARQYDAAGNTVRIDAADGGSEEIPPDPGTGNPGEGPVLQRVRTPGHATAGNTTTSNTTAPHTTAMNAAVAAVREFGYDDANRLHWVRRDGTLAMRYLYNGKGEQVYKIGGGLAVTTLYDEQGRWIGDYDSNSQPIQQAIWLDDLPVGLLVGAGANQMLYYIEADALGAPRVVIDPIRNAAIWRWDLSGEAFGDGAPDEDPDGDGVAFVFDMRFPGQRYDAATGLNYNYFRDYDPETGRYVQSDPIGLGGGISTYGYVGGSPLSETDPFGLSSANARVLVLLAQGKISEAAFYAEMMGLPIAIKLQQLQVAIQNLATKYPLASNRCEQVAKGIFDAMKANKLNPQYLRLNPTKTPYMYIGNGNYVAPQHFAVRLGDMVYDASTGANGMLYSQYIEILNRLNGGQTAYVIRTIDSIDDYL
ncbi:MAG: RHS repeat protein [Lysobacteraceae bacterium]|nr:MAG: RHS repeat protein [Xanthomonadaceae bacterium]